MDKCDLEDWKAGIRAIDQKARRLDRSHRVTVTGDYGKELEDWKRLNFK